MPRRQTYRHVVSSIANGGSNKSLLASARQYADVPGAQDLRHIVPSRGWQADIREFYDTVPAFRAGCNWVGNLLSKAKLVVHKDGKPTTDQLALDALASFFGGSEGQEEMLRLLGINFTATGEGWVVGKPGPIRDEWSVVAAINVTGERTFGPMRPSDLTVEGVKLAQDALPVRLWKAHPFNSEESDCPARALIPTFMEAVRLQQAVIAMAESRLKGNGILFVPSELEVPAVPITIENIDGTTETQMQDLSVSQALTRQIIKVMTTAIQNPGSAAAAAPIVVAVPGEYLEKVNHVDFWTKFDENVAKLREDNLRDMGIGLDMPVEALTGTGEMNHWGSFQMEESAIKIHTEPLLKIIVASLTTGYLHPYLESQGVADFESYTFEADTSLLRMRPNRSKEAMELWDRGALNMRALLIENGFDPDTDLPDQKEQIQFFIMSLARKTSASPEQLAVVLDRLGIKGIPAGEESIGALSTPTLREHPTRTAPDPEESEADGVPENRAITAAASVPVVIDPLVLASEVLVYRALERAGNKLKNKVGPGITVPAADLYLSAPSMEYGECDTLLQDAWSALDRFEYPGVSTARLRNALNEYALFLLRTQKPMTRRSLAQHLMMELAEEAAA